MLQSWSPPEEEQTFSLYTAGRKPLQPQPGAFRIMRWRPISASGGWWNALHLARTISCPRDTAADCLPLLRSAERARNLGREDHETALRQAALSPDQGARLGAGHSRLRLH